MKYLLVVLIALAIAFGFMIKHSNDKRAALAAEKMAYEQKKEAEKQALIVQQLAKSSKKQVDKQISELQRKVTIDYADAKKIIESEKLSPDELRFYRDFSAKWSDSVQLASSTGRIALSGPVKDLQQLKQQFEQHQPRTECETQMYENYKNSYQYTVLSFIEFMSKDEITSSMNQSAASDFLKTANVIFEYC